MTRSTVALAAVVALGLIDTAIAADISRPVYKAPPVVAPLAYNWTGFYFGGHAGAGWTNDDAVSAAITGTGTTAVGGVVQGSDSAGFIGGVHGGYNWQLAPGWLIGVEGDFTWTDLNSNNSAALVTGGGVGIANTTLHVQRDINWLASVRGRLGYSWDRILVYGTGGAAWVDFDSITTASLANGATAGGSFGNTRSGWVVGGGVEWAIPAGALFGSDWTARVEYLHYEFDSGSASANFAPGPGSATFSIADPSVDVVRAGLSYKFGPGGLPFFR